MRKFSIGFLLAYGLGALPFGVILVRLDKAPLAVAVGAAAWPYHLMRVANAVYDLAPAEVVVRRR